MGEICPTRPRRLTLRRNDLHFYNLRRSVTLVNVDFRRIDRSSPKVSSIHSMVSLGPEAQAYSLSLHSITLGAPVA